jgi:hypothetical protein
MYTRRLTFNGATDIDAGVAYLRDEVLPVLHAQRGYRGLHASADRANGVLGILSLWDTEADREASNSALGKARDEALKRIGGQVTIENFEQRSAAVVRPPVPGCAVMITEISMDPASIDDNTAFFESQVLPQMKSQPGFCAVRNMIDRETGRGFTGVVCESKETLNALRDAIAPTRSEAAASRGITFGEPSVREIVFSEVV